MTDRTQWGVHSHNYKKDIYAQLQYEISEKLKTCPSPNRIIITKMLENWLDDNTELGTRTKKEYVADNVPKIVRLLPMCKELRASFYRYPQLCKELRA